MHVGDEKFGYLSFSAEQITPITVEIKQLYQAARFIFHRTMCLGLPWQADVISSLNDPCNGTLSVRDSGIVVCARGKYGIDLLPNWFYFPEIHARMKTSTTWNIP